MQIGICYIEASRLWCRWWRKRRKYTYVLFRMKISTEFDFAPLVKSTCWFILVYLVNNYFGIAPSSNAGSAEDVSISSSWSYFFLTYLSCPFPKSFNLWHFIIYRPTTSPPIIEESTLFYTKNFVMFRTTIMLIVWHMHFSSRTDILFCF